MNASAQDAGRCSLRCSRRTRRGAELGSTRLGLHEGAAAAPVPVGRRWRRHRVRNRGLPPGRPGSRRPPSARGRRSGPLPVASRPPKSLTDDGSHPFGANNPAAACSTTDSLHREPAPVITRRPGPSERGSTRPPPAARFAGKERGRRRHSVLEDRNVPGFPVCHTPCVGCPWPGKDWLERREGRAKAASAVNTSSDSRTP